MPPRAAAVGLTPEEVSRVFPFHLGLDEELRIAQLGGGLARLAPAVMLGDRLADHFAFELPDARTFAALARCVASRVALRLVAGGVVLRGQLLLCGDAPGLPGPAPAGARHLLFLGAPSITSSATFAALGLSLSDLALHDPRAELLPRLRAQEATLEHVRPLLARLAALPMAGELGASSHEPLAELVAAGRRLLTQLDDALELAQLADGRLALRAAPFELHGCLRRANHLFAARAAAKHLSLGLTIDPRLPELARGDELRLSQVLINLVGNAIKFTRTGSVHVAAHLLAQRADDLTLELVVRDTGVGVAPHGRARPGTSSSASTGTSTDSPPGLASASPPAAAPSAALDAASTEGGGLGLALCRQLVQLMGGELSVTDNAGGGSVFRFSAVLGREVLPTPRPVTAQLRLVRGAATPREEPAAPAAGGVPSAAAPKC